MHPDLGHAPDKILEKIRELDDEADQRLSDGQCVVQLSMRIPTWESDFLGREHRTQSFIASIADDFRAERFWLSQTTDPITAEETWEADQSDSDSFNASCSDGERSPWPVVNFNESQGVLENIKVSGTTISYMGKRSSDNVPFNPEFGLDRYTVTYSTDWAEGRNEVDLFPITYKVVLNANTGGFHEARIHPDDVLRMDGR